MSPSKMFDENPQSKILSDAIQDQYADGKAAKLWHKLLGGDLRTQNYKGFLAGLLKKNGCVKILDSACGTGVDSILLVDEGFKVVSVDASDQMLKYALKKRWERRNDPKYDAWVIEEANWLTLYDDIQTFCPGEQFDAILCLGNSFSHILDYDGEQKSQKLALQNFVKCLKPGGLLLIDHRNFEPIVKTGRTPAHNVYNDCQYPLEIKAAVLLEQGEPKVIEFTYCLDLTSDEEIKGRRDFRLRCYPHKLKDLTAMLDAAFGGRAEHTVFGDFKPVEEVPQPAFYIHVLKKNY